LSARSKARKRAVDLLFEAEQRGINARDLLAERLAKPVTEAPLNQYTADLVEGVVAHWTDINELLSTYSQGWSLERMPSVDRAILRLGAYEVLYAEGVPEGVAISEAVELATTLSTDDSPKFVNGLLGRLADRPSPEHCCRRPPPRPGGGRRAVPPSHCAAVAPCRQVRAAGGPPRALVATASRAPWTPACPARRSSPQIRPTYPARVSIPRVHPAGRVRLRDGMRLECCPLDIL
jgi:N utilization substance protein B